MSKDFGFDLSQLRSLNELGKEINQGTVDTMQSVPIDLVVSKVQVRKKFENLDELADSIRTNGLQVPINVTEPDESGHYTIIQGERRWRAAKMAGLETIDVVIRKAPENEQERIIRQLTENIQRQDMNVFEVAEAVEYLSAQKMKTTEIARHLGKNREFVSRFLTLSKCTPEVRSLIERSQTHDVIAATKMQKFVEDFGDEAVETLNRVLEENSTISRTIIDRMRSAFEESDEESETPTKKTETKELPIVLAKGVKRVSDKRWRVAVEFNDEETGETQKGWLATKYVSKDKNKLCVECDNRILTVPIYEVTILGMVNVNEQ